MSLEQRITALIQSLSHSASRVIGASIQVDASFEQAAYTLGLALGRLTEQSRLRNQAQNGGHDQDQKPQHPGQLAAADLASGSSTTHSSSTGSWGEQLLDILWACIKCRHPAVAPIMAQMVSTSSGMEALLARPQLLADLVAAACAEPQGRSLAPLREAVVALVEQSGSRLRQIPEFCAALELQLESGSCGAGELLWALTDSAAGRQVVVWAVLTAAATGAAACHDSLTWSPETGPQPSVHGWAAAVVALAINDDSWPYLVKIQQQLLLTLPALLLLQLPGENTTQHQQQQGWALMQEALSRQELLQHWRLPQLRPGGCWTCSVAKAASCTTHEGAVRAAGAVFKVLLSQLPPALLVSELCAHQEASASLLQLQGRLEALGDTSLLEGVAAMLQRLQEVDFPAVSACYDSWQELYEAAAQLEAGPVASTVEALRRTGSGLVVAMAGLRLQRWGWLPCVAAMLSEDSDSHREQVMGSMELPGLLAKALMDSPADSVQLALVTALLQWPLGQELLCSSQQLQQAVVEALAWHGHTTFTSLGVHQWAQVLQAFVQHPELLGALLRGMLPVAERVARRDAANPYCTIAAAEGLQPALLTPEGGALDLLLAEASRTRFLPPGLGGLLVHLLVHLLVQWPIERVLPALLKRFGSSNDDVVSGALQALQHLTQRGLGKHAGLLQDGSSPAARAAAARDAIEAVAAGLRRLAQAVDMAELVRNMQEAAVGLAQQQQMCRGSSIAAIQPKGQQQQQKRQRKKRRMQN